MVNLNATSLTLLILRRWAPSSPACTPRCGASAPSVSSSRCRYRPWPGSRNPALLLLVGALLLVVVGAAFWWIVARESRLPSAPALTRVKSG